MQGLYPWIWKQGEWIECIRVIFPAFLNCCFNILCVEYVPYSTYVFYIVFSLKRRWLFSSFYFLCSVYLTNAICSLSSMYLLMLVLAWFLRYDTSLLTVANPTCNTCDISLWLYPLLQSSCTLSLLHCICCWYSWCCCCSIAELKCSISHAWF